MCPPIPFSPGSYHAKRQVPLPTLKTATRLLTHIFSVARDTPEFQRQIASPNVPKFSLALITIAEDHSSRELKVGHYELRSFFSLAAYNISSCSPSMRCLYWYLCTLLSTRLYTDDSPRSVFANSTARRDSQWTAQSFKLPPDYMQSFLLPGER